MRLGTTLLLALALGPLGCAVEDDSVGSNTENATVVSVEEVVDYEVQEAVELALDVATPGTVAYSQCEGEDPEEGFDAQISCGTKWTEVAQFVVPAATLAEHAGRELVAKVDSERIVKMSIHATGPDGEKEKLISRPTVFGGDALIVPIEADHSYTIYVAKGDTLINLWGTGEVTFAVTASVE